MQESIMKTINMINVILPSRYKLNKNKVIDIASKKITKYKLFEYDFTIVFVGGRKMKKVASTYKGENEMLPVLTFCYDNEKEQKPYIEIIICFPSLILLSAQKDKTIDYMLDYLIDHACTTF